MPRPLFPALFFGEKTPPQPATLLPHPPPPPPPPPYLISPGGTGRKEVNRPCGPASPPAGFACAFFPVEMKGIFVHDDFSSYGNSAICSSPVVSGNPNIRFMFWIACPAEPFTRLSSTEMTMARFLMRSANTPIWT